MSEGFTLEGDQIRVGRMLTLRAGLKLELVGLTRRGRSCYSIIKGEFGLKGNKQKVLDQFNELIKKEMPRAD